MRVAVVGAGIVGVTTAYELGADGHAVTVFERGDTVAGGASFANAGLVAPGYVSPWAAPGMAGKVLSHLGRAHAPVRIGGALGPATWGWLWRWWRACRPAVFRANRARMHRLADFSKERLDRLTARLHIDYEHGDGFLVLLRTARDLRLAEAGVRTLQSLGAAPEVLDAAGCRAIEPGLNEATALHAGIYSRGDRVGNCRQFAHALRKIAGDNGVQFRFGAETVAIVPGAEPRVRSRSTSESERGGATTNDETFDAVVVCAGMGAAPLLASIGIRLPLQPVYGYSMTAPLRDDALHREPRAALMDERYKVAISRLGNRVRVAGSAELGGAPERQSDAALTTLDKVLDDWFPGVVKRSEAQRWKGARPMLPDGPPVLGPSGAPGIWLNVGHGGSGWALSCGAAKLLADAIAGRPNPIAIDGLGIERLRRSRQTAGVRA